MNTRTVKIMPSILAADMGRLAEAALRCEAAGADGLHVDIMDGHFVPNLSMGPDVVRALRKVVKLHLSVHLMVSRPDFFAPRFVEAGADTVLIHVETACDLRATLAQIQAAGRRAGLTVNPETPAASLWPYLPALDEVLVMSVHPGFGGQAFIAGALPKILEIHERVPGLDISVDGGIDQATAPACAAHGANLLLAGSALFRAPDMRAAIAAMRAASEQARPAAGAETHRHA